MFLALHLILVTQTHRWMGAWNIKLASEDKERSLATELVGPNLEAEPVPMTFPLDRGEEIRKAPMAYIPNLPAKIVQLLNQNDK